MNLRHECETNGCYRAELWDWTPFNDCFGESNIRISDVDGIVERNGQFLMLDGKRVGRDGKRDILDGQRRLYLAFARRGGHVFVFHGQPPHTPQYVRRWLPGGQFVQEEACDLERLKALVSEWYAWANGSGARVAVIEAELEAVAPRRDPNDWDDVVTRWPPDWKVA